MADSHIIALTLKEKGEYVPLTSFLEAAHALKSILQEVDVTVSAGPQASIRWGISDLSMGSATVEVTGIAPDGQPDHTPAVIAACADGLAAIDREVIRPRHFTDKAIEEAKNLTSILSDDVEQIILRYAHGQVNVTQRIAANVDDLFGHTYVAPSYVEGKLESILIHGRRTFAIWEPVHNRRIPCNFEEDMLEQVRNALGRRISVKGEVRFDARDNPIRVRVERLDVLPHEDTLPRAKDLAGLDPDFTGGLDSVEHVRRMRDG